MKRNLFPAIILCALVPLMSGMSCEDLFPDDEEDFPDYELPDPDDPDDPNNPDQPLYDRSWWQDREWEWEEPDDFVSSLEKYYLPKRDYYYDPRRYHPKRVKISSDFPQLLNILDREFGASYRHPEDYLTYRVSPDSIIIKGKDGEEFCFVHITQWYMEEPEELYWGTVGSYKIDTLYNYYYAAEASVRGAKEIYRYLPDKHSSVYDTIMETLVSRIYVRDRSEEWFHMGQKHMDRGRRYEVSVIYGKAEHDDYALHHVDDRGNEWHYSGKDPFATYGTKKDGTLVRSDTLMATSRKGAVMSIEDCAYPSSAQHP
jgi:hypothetical protein